jgi:hypothetical protein
MSKAARFLSALFALAVLFCGYGVGVKIPIANQVALLDHLVGFSSVVFGVVGVWLAVVYPSVMTGLFGAQTDLDTKKRLIDDASALLLPLVLSTVVSILALASRFAVEAVAPMRLFSHFQVSAARGLFFAFLLVLLGAVFCSLFLSLMPALRILSKRRAELARLRTRNRLLSQVDKRS